MPEGLFFKSGVDRGFEQDIKKMNAQMNKLSTNVQQQNKMMAGSFTKLASTIAATFSVAKIVQFGKESVQLYQKQAKALAQVEQGLKSTGNAAGKTFQELQDEATALQKTTLFGDEDILQNSTAQLLTFTNIANEEFTRTQKAALDLATRIGGDLKGATIQLGKALNDPVANLSALSRSGIQFSNEQKALIKSLVETNQLAKAQTIILDELETQFGGSAEAAALADGGFTQLSNSIGDTQEVLGQVITEGLQPIIKELRSFFDSLSEEDIREFVKDLKNGAQVIGVLVVAITAWKLSLIAMNKIQAIHRATSTAMRLEYALSGKTATKTAQLTAVANKKIAGSFKALKTAFAANPIGVLVTLLTIAIPLISEFTSELSTAEKVQKSLNDVNSQAGKSILKQKLAVEELLSVAQDETKSLEKRRDAVEELNKISPEFLGNLSLEIINTDEAKAATDRYTDALLKNARIQAAKGKLIEIEEKLFDLREQGTGAELKWHQVLINSITSGGNLTTAATENALDQLNNLTEAEKELLAIRKALLDVAGEGFTPTGGGDGGGGGGGKDVSTITFYQNLKNALKDAQQGLLELSGTQDDVNKGAIKAQNKIIKNIESQISEQEKILGIKKKEEKIDKEGQKAQKGSIQFLKDKLSLAKGVFELAVNEAGRDIAQKEIDLLEEQIKALEGVAETKVKLTQLSFEELKVFKKAIDEELDGLDKTTKRYKLLIKLREDIQANLGDIIGIWAQDMSGFLDSLSNSLGRVDQKLGKTVSNIAGFIADAGAIVSGIASKNYGQAIAGGASLITKIVASFESPEGESGQETRARLLDEQNELLEIQLDLLNKIKGVDVFDVQIDSLNLIAKQLKDINKEFDVFREEAGVGLRGRRIEQFDTDIEDILPPELLDRYDELIKKQEELEKNFRETLTATTGDAITSAILNGFENGKLGVEDFADTFETLMRQAVLKSFSIRFLESQFDEFFTVFGDAAVSDQGLTDAEFGQLEDKFNTIIGAASAGFEGMDELFERFFGKGLSPVEEVSEVVDVVDTLDQKTPVEDVVSRAGQIQQAITEQTGTELVGRISALAFSNQIVANNSSDALEYAIQNLVYQKAIKENTDYLPEIAENTKRTVEQLENI